MTVVWRSVVVLVLLAVSCGCSDEVPDWSREPRGGEATRVRFNPTNEPLPDLPWPNDLYCWSALPNEGECRPNLPMGNGSVQLQQWVQLVNDATGWSTTSPLRVPFDPAPALPAGPAIDLNRLAALHSNDAFSDDAIYLVDLETGAPVPLRLSHDSRSFVLTQPLALDPSDPRAREPTLSVETLDERIDPITGTFDPERTVDGTPSGLPRYNAGWDVDSDGVLDVLSLRGGRSCAYSTGSDVPANALATRGRCLADSLFANYDTATNSLRIEPVQALQPSRTYAVVLTDRLLDSLGHPVMSPFGQPYHPAQHPEVMRLQDWLARPDHLDWFGSLANTGTSHIAYTWTFTTGTAVRKLRQANDRFLHSQASDPEGMATGTLDTGAVLATLLAHDLDHPCDASDPRDALNQLLQAMSPASEGVRAARREALAHIARLVVGTLSLPDPLEREHASGSRLGSGFDAATGRRTFRFWLALPPQTSDRQPSSLTVALHETPGSYLDWLASAGALGTLGLGTWALEWSSASPRVTEAQYQILKDRFDEACLGRDLLENLMGYPDGPVNPRDELGDAGMNLPEMHYRWRSGALAVSSGIAALVDSLQSSPDRFDFDQDGTPDIQAQPTHLVGVGAGATVALMTAAISPHVDAVAAVDPIRSVPAAWLRGATLGADPAARLQILGPRLAGVPSTALPSDKTRCTVKQSSIRWYGAGLAPEGREVACLSLSASQSRGLASGGTALLTNLATSRRRCVAVSPDGAFSLAIAAQAGDPMELVLWDTTSAVMRFGTDDDCTPLVSDARRVLLLGPTGDTEKLTSELHVPTGGLGYERQSNALSTLFELGEQALADIDPSAFVAEMTNTAKKEHQRGLLLVVTPGNASVPPNQGIGLARAAGLIPSLSNHASVDHPEFARYVLPPSLVSVWGSATVDEQLELGDLEEAAPWLLRHPPEPGACGNNQLDPSCVGSAPAWDCLTTLFDLDSLDEGQTGWGAYRAVPSLRLVRKVGPLSTDSLDDLWEPRAALGRDLSYVPSSQTPLVALAIAMTSPSGSHGLVADDVCQRFRMGAYTIHLIGQFLATGGTDYPPVSHPDTHTCLAASNPREACDFLH